MFFIIRVFYLNLNFNGKYSCLINILEVVCAFVFGGFYFV